MSKSLNISPQNNLKEKVLLSINNIYVEPKIRERLYFILRYLSFYLKYLKYMEFMSISGVTSTCSNTCMTPVGHTGDDTANCCS